MKRFTVILLSFSLLVGTAFALRVCAPVGASFRQLEELNGLELALEEEGLGVSRGFNCTKTEVELGGLGAISPEDLLPPLDVEVEQLLSLRLGSVFAVVYPEDEASFARVLVGRLEEEGGEVALVYPYRPGLNNYRDILDALIKVKDEGKKHIDTVFFLGAYREAILIIPFFRIFKPFPRIAATWRIYDSLMFAYRSFMRTVVFYEWFAPWLPLIHVRGFEIAYRRAYGRYPSRWAALGYDTGKIVAKAILHGSDVRRVRVVGVTGIWGVDEGFRPLRVYVPVRVRELPHLPPPVLMRRY